ncbi:ABC-type transport auxiliary lipoprotein family protein [Caldithrix abyssi]|uniref:ABC-type transport auxiliary lipoprotein component n=1 Tax=Caldithrix abyssi DSM 13497 TaxID=880073 RepID=H1XWC4_CALAY|nr:ABC-type transport auxiliary lipoprotein family protein [Caldithrix abyssi]APF20811.1 ABC-type transport auxiliary lipoprotein component [Caldithrix abyssi DSM 13497]EHO40706.1 hypothetical protein Calab_1078 [Caldithrix abyssi DSM 13497]
MKNLKNKIVATCLLVFFVILLTNCTSKRILKKYYALDAQSDSTLIQKNALPFSVIIEPFWAHPAYKTRQIALRTRSHELEYYYYHQWAEAPDVALRFLLWRKLKTLNVFQNVDLAIGQAYPNYGISGSIDRIEVKNPDKKTHYPQARIKARLELFDLKNRQVVVWHEFDRSAKLPKKFGMNQFVERVNQMVNEELDVFIQKILKSLQ